MKLTLFTADEVPHIGSEKAENVAEQAVTTDHNIVHINGIYHYTSSSLQLGIIYKTANPT